MSAESEESRRCPKRTRERRRSCIVLLSLVGVLVVGLGLKRVRDSKLEDEYQRRMGVQELIGRLYALGAEPVYLVERDQSPSIGRWLGDWFSSSGHPEDIAGQVGAVMVLDLEGTMVTDSVIADFGVLTELEDLSLANTQVTDAGIMHLKDLKNLQSVDLSGTKVTVSGIRELKRARPKLIVVKRH